MLEKIIYTKWEEKLIDVLMEKLIISDFIPFLCVFLTVSNYVKIEDKFLDYNSY